MDFTIHTQFVLQYTCGLSYTQKQTEQRDNAEQFAHFKLCRPNDFLTLMVD